MMPVILKSIILWNSFTENIEDTNFQNSKNFKKIFSVLTGLSNFGVKSLYLSTSFEDDNVEIICGI